MGSKRFRSGNWSNKEKDTLLSLIRDRLQIIENKSIDGRMVAKKKRNWENIARLFEAEHGKGRGIIRLKEQWKRMKLSSKRSVSEYNKYQKGTGGGGSVSPSRAVPTEMDRTIMELLPSQFEKDESAFDDDCEILRETGGDGALPENGKINPPTELDYQVMSLIPCQLEKDSSIYDDDTELGMLEVVPDTTGIVVQKEEPTIEELSTSKLMDEEPQKEIDTPQRRQKRKYKEMSAYEEAMLALQKEKIAEQREEVKRRREMEEELHKKELEIKREAFEIKKEELEIKRLEKVFWQKKIENLNKEF